MSQLQSSRGTGSQHQSVSKVRLLLDFVFFNSYGAVLKKLKKTSPHVCIGEHGFLIDYPLTLLNPLQAVIEYRVGFKKYNGCTIEDITRRVLVSARKRIHFSLYKVLAVILNRWQR